MLLGTEFNCSDEWIWLDEPSERTVNGGKYLLSTGASFRTHCVSSQLKTPCSLLHIRYIQRCFPKLIPVVDSALCPSDRT